MHQKPVNGHYNKHNLQGGLPMSDAESQSNDNERIPVMQRILDNPFLLLFLGVVVPTVFYILWGIMEIITIPIAK
jgi:hypothetical protein